MTQTYVQVPTEGPKRMSEVAIEINQSINSLLSSNIGAARPGYATEGMFWLSKDDDIIKAYIYNGSVDKLLFTIGSGDQITINAETGLTEAEVAALIATAVANIDTAGGSLTEDQANSIIANTSKLTFPVSAKNKLAGIEANATADQSSAEIKTSLEALSGNSRLDASAVKNLPTPATGLTAAQAAAIVANTAKATYPSRDQTKLRTVTTGANVNVNADWNATFGDALILNKPTSLGGGGTSASAPAQFNTLNTLNLPNGIAIVNSFISSGYILGDMNGATILGITIIGAGGDHNTHLIKYSDISGLTNSNVSGVPNSSNSIQFVFGNIATQSVFGSSVLLIGRQNNGTVLYALSASAPVNFTITLSTVTSAVGSGTATASNDLEPVLPEDLEVLSANTTLEDIGNRVTTMVAADIGSGGVGFFNRRGIADDIGEATTAGGSLTPDNDKIFQLSELRIETNHERLSLASGITINTVEYNLTETQVASSVYANKTVRVYQISGFAGFVAGEPYTIKLKKFDGDFMIFGDPTKIVLSSDVEADYRVLRNKRPTADFDIEIIVERAKRVYSVPHGLESTPVHVWGVFECIIENHGFSVGDVVSLNTDYRTSSEGCILYWNAINVVAFFGSSGYQISSIENNVLFKLFPDELSDDPEIKWKIKLSGRL